MNTEHIHDLRKRVLAGETITRDEVRAAIEFLAPARLGAIDKAASASTEAKIKKQKGESVDLSEFLDP